MDSGSWKFLDAGYGKGPVEGIGEAMKKAIHSFVSTIGNIVDAKSM